MAIGLIVGLVMGVLVAGAIAIARRKKPMPLPPPSIALLTTQPSGERPQPRPSLQPTPACARCGGKLEQRDGRWFCVREEQYI